MSENPVDPSISPESVPDPDGHDDGEHPSNPDKTGESIDESESVERPGEANVSHADRPQGDDELT